MEMTSQTLSTVQSHGLGLKSQEEKAFINWFYCRNLQETAQFFASQRSIAWELQETVPGLRGNWSTAIAKLCWMWWRWVSMREMQWGALATGQTQELPEIHGYNFQRAEILLWKSRRNMFSEIWVEMLT